MAERIKHGGPAFPYTENKPQTNFNDADEPLSVINRGTTFPGMTLRDYLAGQALSGLLAGGAYKQYSDARNADIAYALADCMLAAREATV